LKNNAFFDSGRGNGAYSSGQIVKIGESTVDFKGLSIDGPAGHHSMEPKIGKLLSVLVSHAGEVRTREELITEVWGVEFGGDERLSRGVSILRKALGDSPGNHSHIVTISKVGYRLIAKVDDDCETRTLSTPEAPNIETTPQRIIDIVKGSEETEKISEKSKFSIRRVASILMVAASVLIVGFWALSVFKTSEILSVQARIDNGFSKVENFHEDNAISEAQNVFNGILSQNPNHTAATAGLAFSLFREYTHLERDPEVLKRAKSHAQLAFRQDEHLAISNIAVAWASEFDGDFKRAHEFLDRADILSPNHPLTLEGRYRVFGKSGDIDKAVDISKLAVEAHPNNPLFFGNLGHAHVLQNRPQEAEANFRRSIELNPDSPRAYAQLAHSLYLQGRTEEAITEIQNGLSVDETPHLYNNLGTYLFFQGHYALAVSAFEKTLVLDGDTHSYLFWANLGDAYRWSEDRSDEAATAYRRALQLLQIDLDKYPDNVNLRSRAAMFNAKLGNLDKARAYMNSFTLTPKSENVQLYRAVVTHEILSERGKALGYLETAIETGYPLIEIFNDPELSRLRQDPSYHKLLAKTQTDQGE